MSSEGCCLTWKADVKGSFKGRRLRRQDFERKILHGCQKKSWEGEKKIYYDF